MQDLQYAIKEKVVEDHNVIDDAIRDEAKVCVARGTITFGLASDTFPL